MIHPSSLWYHEAAGHVRTRSLLGTYPVPMLHLVGAPVPASHRSPSQWVPTAAVPQYGIDYTFANGRRGQPVTWCSERLITVRIAGGHAPAVAPAVTQVVAELTVLTGLRLHVGDPWPRPLDPRHVPRQEIHVTFWPTPAISDAAGPTGKLPGGPVPPAPGLAGMAGAAISPTGRHYVSGYAAVVFAPAGAIEPDSELGGVELAALRHVLAHALGLGHAARPSLLMHHRIPLIEGGYGRGDRHGLALLGLLPPAKTSPSPSRQRRSHICAA